MAERTLKRADISVQRASERRKNCMKNKKWKKMAIIAAGCTVCCYIIGVYVKNKEKNKVKPEKRDFYEKIIKRAFDKSFSLVGMLTFWPIYGIIALAIIMDDPGPVLFTQKRIGKGKRPFTLHKFRTMKMSAPHDVPTHQLENPEQYITRVGKFLRKYSLDELPQIWDIFIGNMSIIGPRPALWNQDDLVAERDKYGANGVLPGLTGWAQINGRDELEVAEKARLDGEYAGKLRQGGWKALLFDARCFAGTIFSVIGSEGVVEGGTGKLHRIGKMKAEGGTGKICGKSSMTGDAGCRMERDAGKLQAGLAGITAEEAGFADYGHLKRFDIDTSGKNKKRVLVTGAGSYIGESFEAYAKGNYPGNFTIDTVDMRDAAWRETDFSPYDAVFHVAGIAHADVGKVSEEDKKKYYAVNTDLAIEAAEKAKREGVRQFVLMSSMIIYGDSAPYGKEKIIDEHTLPAPVNFYGDSKWQADKGVRRLADENFHVAVLRPPMIYGKGSKGNYPILAKLAKRLPVFPDVENRRSMLYIGNLCEFLCRLVLSGEGGVYFPQNGEHAKTSEMARQIAGAAGKRIWVTKLLSPMVAVGSHVPGKVSGLVDKAFGNSAYSQALSRYEGLEYQKAGLAESLRETEAGECAEPAKGAVLILANHDVVVYNFRLELVERLLAEGYEVHVSSPYGERIDDLVRLGVKYHGIAMERHGMNPVKELRILREYRKLMKAINPVVAFGYTIKPNIYGAMAARLAHTPFVANITGLGTAVENGGARQKAAILLYKAAFSEIQKVFFQNEENREFFLEHGIAIGKHALLPGSGVNLERYPVTPLPDCGDGKMGEPVRFAFISRIMREKGIEQYLDVAEEIRKRYPAAEFHVCGFCEEEYDGRLDEMDKKGIVIYHGMVRDVAGFMGKVHCIVHPSYYPEGISNVLLEACACGRAIITTDRAGCREVVRDGVNGYRVAVKSVGELTNAVEQFIKLDMDAKRLMGMNARRLVEEKFDRNVVVDAYMEEVGEAAHAS